MFFKILNTLSIKPTYFELFVAFAYWYFAKIKVEYAVIEVGLGGLLDGTNVIHRPDKVCVITDIGIDHTRILGSKLSAIARQKAGIIQDHNHVFMYQKSSVIEQEIVQRVREMHAVIHYVQPAKINGEMTDFQKRNWLLAKTTCEFIFDRQGLKTLAEDQWEATRQVAIPGRFETLSQGGKTIVFDGAHNSQKIDSLVGSFKTKFPGVSPAILLAIGDNKDMHVEEIATKVSDLANFTVITTFQKGRSSGKSSIDPVVIAKYFQKGDYLIEADLEKAVQMLLAREEKVILVTGSLYLVGAVKKLFKEA